MDHRARQKERQRQRYNASLVAFLIFYYVFIIVMFALLIFADMKGTRHEVDHWEALKISIDAMTRWGHVPDNGTTTFVAWLVMVEAMIGDIVFAFLIGWILIYWQRRPVP